MELERDSKGNLSTPATTEDSSLSVTLTDWNHSGLSFAMDSSVEAAGTAKETTKSTPAPVDAGRKGEEDYAKADEEMAKERAAMPIHSPKTPSTDPSPTKKKKKKRQSHGTLADLLSPPPVLFFYDADPAGSNAADN